MDDSKATAARRPRGEGSISPLPSGRFRVRAVVAGKRVTLGTFDTEELARRALSHEPERSDGEGESARAGVLTLAIWGETVLRRRKAAGARGIKRDRERWSCYVTRWPGARKPLHALKRAELKTWIAGLAVSVATKRRLLGQVRSIFEEAVDDELLDDNPLAGVRLKSTGRTSETSTYLTNDELLRLLDALAPSDRAIVAVAAGSGLRQGEQRSLLLEDVHLDVPEPHMLVRFGAPGLPTKSGKPRTVQLFGIALHAMREWLEAHRRPAWSALAFPTVRGRVRGKGRMIARDTWLEALARAGITRRVRWQDLRHTCATLLLDGAWGGTWTKDDVQDLLGHASVTVTERYARQTGERSRQAANTTRAVWPGQAPRDVSLTYGHALPEYMVPEHAPHAVKTRARAVSVPLLASMGDPPLTGVRKSRRNGRAA